MGDSDNDRTDRRAGVPPWPLVGRDEEVDLVVRTAAAGEARGVAIYGGAGVGKTRLAGEVLDRLGRAGWGTLHLTGTRAAAAVPFGAVAPLVTAVDAGAGPRDQLDVMAVARQVVAERSTPQGLVLVVDDAQCLDEASAALVHQLAGGGDAFVVATVRVGEPVADAVTGLWKDGLAVRLDLQPLADHDVRRLLTAALDGPVDEPLAFALLQRARGNTLYLRELVHAARAAGALRWTGDRWRLDGALPASDALVELIALRLGDLPPALRRALELVAIGEPLPLDVLDGHVEPATVDDALDRGLLVGDEDDRRAKVRFAHPLYGEVIAARLDPLRARRIAGQLADHLAATGMRRANDLVRHATWQLDAGRTCEPRRLLAATTRALAAGHHAAARRFADAAGRDLAPGAGDPGDPDLQAEVRLTASRVFVHEGRFGPAADVLGGVGEGASERVRARVVQAQAAIDFFGAGDPDRAIARLAQGAGRYRDPEARARLAVCEAYALLGAGRVDEARRRLDAPDVPTGTPAVDALRNSVAGLAAAFAGRFDEAERIALEGMTVDPGALDDPPTGLRWATSVLLLVLLGRGRIDEARTLAGPVLERSLHQHHRTLRRDAAAVAGWMSLQAGDVDGALDLLREGADPGAGVDIDGIRPLALAGLAGALVAAGRVAEAAGVVEGADAETRTSPRLLEPCLDAARVVVADRTGQPGRARTLLDAARVRRAANGERYAGIVLTGAALDIGALDRAVADADRLVAAVDGPLVELLHAEAHARARGDGDGLEDVRDRADAIGLRLAAWRCARAAVALREGQGDERGAIRARARAHELRRRCPGLADAPTGGDGPRPDLTPRELEVARLAAGGMASAAIAEQLFVSVRTVDHHLGRVYLKVGVSRRQDLATVPGLVPV